MALPASCPLCQSNGDHQVVATSHVYGSESGGRAFFHCAFCDVRYLYPRLTAEQERHFYASEFESFMAGRAGTAGGWTKVDDHIRANEATRLRRMRYLEQHLPDTARILEVGCSSGFLLESCGGFSCIFNKHSRWER